MAEVDAPTYVALKRMIVHELNEDGSNRLGEDGRPLVRQCQPGDPIPEALSWKNLWREVRAGRVGLAGTPFAGPALADSMRRQLADRQARPKSQAETGAAGRRDRRRRAKTAEQQASDAAVEQATGEEAPEPAVEDAAPQAVEPEEVQPTQE